MIRFETERLICKSDLDVENGKLVESKKEKSIDILKLEPTTGEESGFVFYSKEILKLPVCHIAVVSVRGRFEVSYGVDNVNYRNQGYMTEALNSLCDWLFKNINQEIIWALPNGEFKEASIRVLRKCDFKESDIENGLVWYELRKDQV